MEYPYLLILFNEVEESDALFDLIEIRLIFFGGISQDDAIAFIVLSNLDDSDVAFLLSFSVSFLHLLGIKILDEEHAQDKLGSDSGLFS